MNSTDTSCPRRDVCRLRRVRLVGWCGAVGLALVHSWIYLHDIRDVDGVSYLDLGDALLRADWSMAINAYWSPLYAVVLAVAIRASRPLPAWEYPVTQAVNLAAYVWALACFEWLLRTLVAHNRCGDGHTSGDTARAVPEWTLFAVGYPAFIWSALYWQYYWLQTPDTLVAGLVFVAAALLVRIHSGVADWRTFLTLGLVLGFGYLAKAALFPVAFVFLTVAGLAAANFPHGLTRSAAAAAVFLLVAAPWILALSASKQRLTFGESGRLNYAWYVNNGNQFADWPHWEGQAGYGVPAHPSRRILVTPAIYEFGSPIEGSYPMWYDPSYWHEGLQPRFEFRAQIRRLITSARFYRDFFNYGPQPVLTVVLLFLCAARRTDRLRTTLLRHWPVFVPAVAALVMYSLVNVEGRYVAPFVLLLWFGALAGLRRPMQPAWRRAANGLIVAAVVVMVGQVAWATARDLRVELPSDFDGRLHARIARDLQSLGVAPDSRVGVIGSGLNAARWARLAHVRIVAELPRPAAERFWEAGRVAEGRVVNALCSAGALGIVAQHVPRGSLRAWIPLPNADGYAYRVCQALGSRPPQPTNTPGSTRQDTAPS